MADEKTIKSCDCCFKPFEATGGARYCSDCVEWRKGELARMQKDQQLHIEEAERLREIHALQLEELKYQIKQHDLKDEQYYAYMRELDRVQDHREQTERVLKEVVAQLVDVNDKLRYVGDRVGAHDEG
jgi:uncharacterized Zn finger protein (UPF0148 family)